MHVYFIVLSNDSYCTSVCRTRSFLLEAEILMFYVAEAAATPASNVGRDVTLLLASCVTAVAVVSLVCLHCLSRKVACRRRSTVYAVNTAD